MITNIPNIIDRNFHNIEDDIEDDIENNIEDDIEDDIEDEYINCKEIYSSQNESIPIHTCEYCMRIINIPIYRYKDNTFCNITCRSKQIDIDNTKI